MDINKAKETPLTFVTVYNIEDVESLMVFTSKWHSHAVEWDDKRTKSGHVQPENYNWNIGYAGKYYNFEELSDEQMEQIKVEVIEYMFERRKGESYVANKCHPTKQNYHRHRCRRIYRGQLGA